jgi:hypothetical protein
VKVASLSICLLALSCCSVYSYAKEKHPLQTATVLSQDIGTNQVDRGVVTSTPLVRYSNIAKIETQGELMTWEEVTTYKFGTTTHEVQTPVPLPVHGSIQFYRDGNFCFVTDEGGKKHKFLIFHIEAKSE